MAILAAEGGRFASLLLCIVVVLVLGRIVAILFGKIGQPVVIGEILIGVALGPSVLGLFPGDLDGKLFPAAVQPYLKVVASLGLVLFMFIIGLEVDLDAVRRSGRRAVAISLTSIAIPFLLGFAVLGPMLHSDNSCVAAEATLTAQGQPPVDECTSDELGKKQDRVADESAEALRDGHDVPKPVSGLTVDFVPFALFLGVSMSGTAFPVLARILAERDMFKIPLGLLLVACAAIDDIMAFTLLAFAAAMASGAGVGEIAVMLGQLVAFVAVLFGVVRPLLDRFVVARYRATGVLGAQELSLLFIGLLMSSYITTQIGVHELIGAFLFGAAVPRRAAGGLFHDVARRVESVSLYLFLPVFFVIAGQGVDIRGLGVGDIVAFLAILACACAGKILGASGAALATGVPRRQAFAVGAMMNTRGLTELVILSVARDANVINDRVYTLLVLMAIITTAMAGPLLKVVYPERWLQRDIAEAERRRNSSATDRIAVVVTTPSESKAAVELASAIAGGRDTGSVMLVRLTPRGGLDGFASGFDEMEELRQVAAATGVSATVIARSAADPAAETIAELDRLAPSAVVLPVDAHELSAAVRRGGADVVTPGGRAVDGRGVMVDGGSSASVELGARLAMFHAVPLSVAGGLGRRTRRQLMALGVDVGEAADGARVATDLAAAPDVVAVIEAGERDRLPLVEALDAFTVPREVVPLSPL